ncbi:hypothetical protein [[Mycobacterium] wendilense]|uniref:PASTA domain-containing protein n=1 Tax=[Mycobacterium] wendilense TaxID=3064284 RepID=A0ABM9MDI9_9MYCO|nr:hypothetical protein [Mycolicibacterium sp. MU0050]CAJ1582565.1 hypothetical protein MU0050_002167 [Mycolicibacterium sp. MU0050]
MKKLALFAVGASAAISMAVVGATQAGAAPPDVTGEPYGKAVAVLKNQGYRAIFGGSIGNDLPQSQCVVIAQEASGNGAQRLRLDCNLAPGQERPNAPNTHRLVPPGGSVPGGVAGSGAPAAPGGQGGQGGAQRPTPGAGTVTVTPRPVG